MEALNVFTDRTERNILPHNVIREPIIVRNPFIAKFADKGFGKLDVIAKRFCIIVKQVCLVRGATVVHSCLGCCLHTIFSGDSDKTCLWGILDLRAIISRTTTRDIHVLDFVTEFLVESSQKCELLLGLIRNPKSGKQFIVLPISEPTAHLHQSVCLSNRPQEECADKTFYSKTSR